GRQATAEDEQEQHRLDERCDDTQPVAAESDHLPLPDHADGAQVVPEPKTGYGHCCRRSELSDGHASPPPLRNHAHPLTVPGFLRVANRRTGVTHEDVV